MSPPRVTKGRMLLGKRPSDHEPLDLARALVDLADADVALNTLNRKVGYIPVTTVDLQRRRTCTLRHLGREQLRHQRLRQSGRGRIAHASRVSHQLRRLLE